MGFDRSDLLRLQQTHKNLKGTFHCGTRLQNYIQDITWKALWRPKFPFWNLYFCIHNLKNTPMCICLLFPPCQRVWFFSANCFSPQSVSCRLFKWKYGLNSRAFHVVFVVRRLKRDRILTENFDLTPPIIIPPTPHIHSTIIQKTNKVTNSDSSSTIPRQYKIIL
jgi:hypothetical protein